MVDFVALLQAPQDGNRVLDRRLLDEDLLQAPLESRVLLDVLAVLIQGRGTDGMELASRQGRFQHVAGVHRSFGLAGAHHRVDFVDEQNHLALLLGKIVDDRLQALLELSPELRARDQRSHVQRQDAFAFQAFGDLVVDDPLGQSLDDRRLADPRLTDEHGIVLRAPLQDLDRSPDLVVTPDDRIELALLGSLGQIDGEALERLPLLLGIGIVDLLPTPHSIDRLFQSRLGATRFAQHLTQRPLVLSGRQQKQLARDELVAALLSQLVRHIE